MKEKKEKRRSRAETDRASKPGRTSPSIKKERKRKWGCRGEQREIAFIHRLTIIICGYFVLILFFLFAGLFWIFPFGVCAFLRWDPQWVSFLSHITPQQKDTKKQKNETETKKRNERNAHRTAKTRKKAGVENAALCALCMYVCVCFFFSPRQSYGGKGKK
jgi:hypothetical protein